MEVSIAAYRREPVVTLDPIKLFAIIGGVICASLLLIFIWVLLPTTSGSAWPLEFIAGWTLMFLAPLIVLLWASTAASPWAARTYKWMRRLIQLHAALALLIMLGGCARLHLHFGYALAACGALIVDALVLFWTPWRAFDPEDVLAYRKIHLCVVGAIIGAVLTWSVANIGLIVWQAQLFAHGRPYCIQIGGRGLDYAPATSLVELNGISLHARPDRHGIPVGYHALLVIETADGLEWQNWSYLFQKFVLIPPKARIPRPTCSLRADFVGQLPIW
jgi:hypothetical protein